MQAYWSRPLGCGECLAGTDSLVRSLTLIHWTLIRMALPGLDASVITAFVSRSPSSPILSLAILFFLFHYCCSTWAILPDLMHNLLEETNSRCNREGWFCSTIVFIFFNLSLLNSREGVKLTRSLIHRNLVHLTNAFNQTNKKLLHSGQGGGGVTIQSLNSHYTLLVMIFQTRVILRNCLPLLSPSVWSLIYTVHTLYMFRSIILSHFFLFDSRVQIKRSALKTGQTNKSAACSRRNTIMRC